MWTIVCPNSLYILLQPLSTMREAFFAVNIFRIQVELKLKTKRMEFKRKILSEKINPNTLRNKNGVICPANAEVFRKSTLGH